MTVGSRIARLRKAKDLSQEEFASKIQVSRGAFQYYERGERDLPSNTLDEICKTFSDDPNRLLNGEPSPQLMKILSEVVSIAFEIARDLQMPIEPNRLWRVVSRVVTKVYTEYDSLEDVVIDKEEIRELVELIA